MKYNDFVYFGPGYYHFDGVKIIWLKNYLEFLKAAAGRKTMAVCLPHLNSEGVRYDWFSLRAKGI